MRTNYFGTWRYLLMPLLILLSRSLLEAAELKEDVIKELAADLAEINSVIASEREKLPRGGVVEAGKIDPTTFVAGDVDDLKEGLKDVIIAEEGAQHLKHIGTWAGAFASDANVAVSGFEPVGEIRTATDLEGNQVPWASARIIRTASLPMEGRIRDAISRLEQLKKKYAGKGLIVKGFSLSLPLLSFSVNFEFE